MTVDTSRAVSCVYPKKKMEKFENKRRGKKYGNIVSTNVKYVQDKKFIYNSLIKAIQAGFTLTGDVNGLRTEKGKIYNEFY